MKNSHIWEPRLTSAIITCALNVPRAVFSSVHDVYSPIAVWIYVQIINRKYVSVKFTLFHYQSLHTNFKDRIRDMATLRTAYPRATQWAQLNTGRLSYPLKGQRIIMISTYIMTTKDNSIRLAHDWPLERAVKQRRGGRFYYPTPTWLEEDSNKVAWGLWE